MALLDSTMKESQRLNNLTTGKLLVSIVSPFSGTNLTPKVAMAREAFTNVTISDGTIIPKGYKVSVESRLLDPTLYPNPEKFEPDRFLKLRDTDSSKWHFVTTSPKHMGFGYGRHACPGRFFATNEMKTILTHLLIKYDWKLTQHGRLPRL